MSETNATTPTQSEQNRAVLVGASSSAPSVHRQRWAVIVGISKYQDASLNLRYAHRDADELFKLITTPRGGGFDEKRIVKLIDEEATTDSLRKALRTFLKKPVKEDIVLIYLACHGAFDPDRPQNVYLITHDTDPDDVAGTAYPMENIYTALQPHNLYSERVILIADTCHSAAVGRIAGLRNMGEKAVVNRYLQELSNSQAGMAVLTSSETNETSREGKEWGEGHGVFTYHLLQGLRGKAENDQGIVTAGDLFDYVRENVREDTGNQQHPVIGSSQFDRDLPLAITGDISANDHFTLGRHLLRLGWLLDDSKRFGVADRQLGEALRLAGEFGESLPEAHLLQGQARLAVGEPTRALQALKVAVEGLDEDLQAEALFWQVMVLLNAEKMAEALDIVDVFLGDHGTDWRAPFLEQARPITAIERGTKRALLIGINEYRERNLQIEGAVNDIDMAARVLQKRFGFQQDNIVRCQDQKATRQGIVDALKNMGDITEEEDTLVIWYSGWANGDIEEKTFLFPIDYQIAEGKNGIDAEELHDLLQAIPAHSKTAVLDTNTSQKLIDLARRDPGYDLYLAADRVGYHAKETTFEGEKHGAFSFTLLSTLEQWPVAKLSAIEKSVKANLAKRKLNQTPLFLSSGQWPFNDKAGLPVLLWNTFQFALRRHYGALTLADIRATERRFAGIGKTAYPPFYQSLGRAYLAKKAYKEGLAALQVASRQAETTGYEDADLPLDLALAQVRQWQYEDALSTLQGIESHSPEHERLMDEIISLVEALTDSQLNALLVGVSLQGEGDRDLPAAQGAANDVEDVKHLLIDHLGVDEANVVVLTGVHATGEAIIQAFDELVAKAAGAPALFFFAGNGSYTEDGKPTILPFDARLHSIPNDVVLSELAHRAGGDKSNLVSIVDAGWSPGMELPWGASWGSRYVSPEVRPAAGLRALGAASEYVEEKPAWQPDLDWLHARQIIAEENRLPKIGRVTLYPASIQAAFVREELPSGAAVAETDFPSPFQGGSPAVRGALTVAVIKAIVAVMKQPSESAGDTKTMLPDTVRSVQADIDENVFTYEHLDQELQKSMKWLQPFLVGAVPAEHLFTNTVQEEQVQALIRRRTFEDPLRETETLLKRLLDRRNGKGPEILLNLGIVYATLGEFDRSIAALDTAIDQRDLASSDICNQARYHLGRVLTLSGSDYTDISTEMRYGDTQSGDLDRAISELRDATSGDPDNAAAYYYLGLAIRNRVEQEQLVEAESAWQTYLKQGAPLGHTDEVKAFLDLRRGTGSGPGWGPGTPSGDTGTR